MSPKAQPNDGKPARATWRERGALWSFFGLAPIAAAGGGLALVPMMSLAALIGVRYRAFLRGVRAAWAPLTLLALFLAWLAASSLWSPYGDPAQAGRVAGTVLAGVGFIALTANGGNAVARAAGMFFWAFMIFMLMVEFATNLAINRLFNDEPNLGIVARNTAKGASVLVVAVWGVMAAMVATQDWRGFAWKAMLAATAFLALQFDQNANIVAFVLAGAAFAFGWLAPRLAPLALTGGAAAWLLAAPFATPLLLGADRLIQAAPLSWQMRAQIWEFTIARIQEKPLVGWGLDAGRTMDQAMGTLEGVGPFKLLPLHPHSFSLQIWLETGAVGAGLLAAAWLAGGWWVARRLGDQRIIVAALSGVFTATMAIWNVSYGAWQEWFITAPFIGAALACAALGMTGREKPSPVTLTFGG